MRKIAVISTSRADYSIYRSLMRLLSDDKDIELQIIAAGMHLVAEFGNTVDEIGRDGFVITEKVRMLSGGDAPIDIARDMGKGMAVFGEAFERLRPDIVVVLGDRFEMFSAAVAAHAMALPLAHIHGGELTLGAMDECFRHAMTKLSHLHFVSTAEYGKRVCQMGEESWRVVVSGAPALDNLWNTEPITGAELEEKIGMSVKDGPLMVTYHPTTHDARALDAQAEILFQALKETGHPLVFTAPNADEGGRRLTALMKVFVRETDNARYIDNLGTRAYFGLMQSAAAMVGNSSSGIIEAASFELPVVNIGSRQEGRIRAANVLDVEPTGPELAKCLSKAISPDFREGLKGLKNPYVADDEQPASAVIHKVLKDLEATPELMKKGFVDIT